MDAAAVAPVQRDFIQELEYGAVQLHQEMWRNHRRARSISAAEFWHRCRMALRHGIVPAWLCLDAQSSDEQGSIATYWSGVLHAIRKHFAFMHSSKSYVYLVGNGHGNGGNAQLCLWILEVPSKRG